MIFYKFKDKKEKKRRETSHVSKEGVFKGSLHLRMVMAQSSWDQSSNWISGIWLGTNEEADNTTKVDSRIHDDAKQQC